MRNEYRQFLCRRGGFGAALYRFHQKSLYSRHSLRRGGVQSSDTGRSSIVRGDDSGRAENILFADMLGVIGAPHGAFL